MNAKENRKLGEAAAEGFRKGIEEGMKKMKQKRLNGYWTKNDGSCYVFVVRVYKAGYVTGFRYFKRPDGKEVIDTKPFRATHEEIERDYIKGMKE